MTDIGAPTRHMTILQSRGKNLLWLAFSLAFMGFLVGSSPDSELKAWLAIGFFALCSAVFAWLLLRPHRLILEDHGFTLSGGFMWSPKTTAWTDVENFFVYSLGRGGKMIGYNFISAVRKTSLIARLSRRIAADAALPRGWPMSPEHMVEALDAYRIRAQPRAR